MIKKCSMNKGSDTRQLLTLIQELFEYKIKLLESNENEPKEISIR